MQSSLCWRLKPLIPSKVKPSSVHYSLGMLSMLQVASCRSVASSQWVYFRLSLGWAWQPVPRQSHRLAWCFAGVLRGGPQPTVLICGGVSRGVRLGEGAFPQSLLYVYLSLS
jgi:hypothetical protein